MKECKDNLVVESHLKFLRKILPLLPKKLATRVKKIVDRNKITKRDLLVFEKVSECLREQAWQRNRHAITVEDFILPLYRGCFK